MIIGLDETGDFSDGSRAWFVAAFIRPSTYADVVAALRKWERRTRRRLGLVNELKGNQIDAQAAEEFVADVVGTGDGNSVRWTAYRVDMNGASSTAMAVQRQLIADGYERWADMHAQSEDPELRRLKRVLRQYAAWIRSRGDRQMLKIATLALILPELQAHAFAIAISNRYDDELVELSFRIDRGYIKSSELPNWRDLVRNAFIEGTRKHPTPFSPDWPPNHPVLQAFVEREDGDTYMLHSSFKDRIDFYDSSSTPAIRIADVLAAILRRGLEAGPLTSALRLLDAVSFNAYPYTLLSWTDDVPDARTNPYERFRDVKG